MWRISVSVLKRYKDCFFEKQAVVWRNVSRPIRKGAIFNRMQPQQKPLSRHYRFVLGKDMVSKLKNFTEEKFAKSKNSADTKIFICLVH